MELKGRDLYRLRKDRNNGSFTLGTAVRVALVTLEVENFAFRNNN